MTAHQRAELLKLVANDDSNQKISYKKCEKIAEDLNLTLEQVCFLFVFGKSIPLINCRKLIIFVCRCFVYSMIRDKSIN